MPHRSLRIVDSDRPPAALVDRAKAAFADHKHGALAALVHDSLLDDGAPASDHLLRFEHRELRLEARLSVGPADASVAGHVTPSISGRVCLRFASGDALVENLVDGDFAFAGVHHGVVCLDLLGGAAPTHVRTDWFQV
jgi:hypothetical protein